MIREELGRLVVKCDCCPARMELGPTFAARARNRMPSGWVRGANDTHYCPLCAPSMAALYVQAIGHRPQPLV